MKKEKIPRKIVNKRPVENHETAAWINTGKLKGEARIPITNYIGVDQAKEYVDENEK